MAPKQKPVAEWGSLQERHGTFRARVRERNGTAVGLARQTSFADLTAARLGATSSQDVACNLKELAAAARGVPATSAAEQRQPETSTAASAAKPAAEQRRPTLSDDAAEPSPSRPAAEQSHACGRASADGNRQNYYPTVCFRILPAIFCSRCCWRGSNVRMCDGRCHSRGVGVVPMAGRR